MDDTRPACTATVGQRPSPADYVGRLEQLGFDRITIAKLHTCRYALKAYCDRMPYLIAQGCQIGQVAKLAMTRTPVATLDAVASELPWLVAQGLTADAVMLIASNRYGASALRAVACYLDKLLQAGLTMEQVVRTGARGGRDALVLVHKHTSLFSLGIAPAQVCSIASSFGAKQRVQALAAYAPRLLPLGVPARNLFDIARRFCRDDHIPALIARFEALTAWGLQPLEICRIVCEDGLSTLPVMVLVLQDTETAQDRGPTL